MYEKEEVYANRLIHRKLFTDSKGIDNDIAGFAGLRGRPLHVRVQPMGEKGDIGLRRQQQLRKQSRSFEKVIIMI